MFGVVYRLALLAAVISAALIRRDEGVEYSPWCSCPVPVRLMILRPRHSPCKQHNRFRNSQMYLSLLLLLLAGDIELNPGPVSMGGESASDVIQPSSETMEASCVSCGEISEKQNLTLRSRRIGSTMIKCAVEACTSLIHDQCRRKTDHHSRWKCSYHPEIDTDQTKPDADIAAEESSCHQPPKVTATDSLSPSPTNPGISSQAVHQSSSADLKIPRQAVHPPSSPDKAMVDPTAHLPSPDLRTLGSTIHTSSSPDQKILGPAFHPSSSPDKIPGLTAHPSSPDQKTLGCTVHPSSPEQKTLEPTVHPPMPALKIPRTINHQSTSELKPLGPAVHPSSPTGNDSSGSTAYSLTEPLPGPSFISVTLMDVMEAVRQTHVQLDRLFEEVNQVKQQFKALQQQGNRESGHSPARHSLPAFAEQ